MTTIAKEYIDMPVRLPWHTVCALACRAMIEGVTFDALVTLAMEDFILTYNETSKQK